MLRYMAILIDVSGNNLKFSYENNTINNTEFPASFQFNKTDGDY